MMRRRTRPAVLAPLAAVASLIASMTAGTPIAAASTPDCPAATTGISFCFNAPPPTDGNRADNNAIQTQIDNLIGGAGKGQTVRVSIYELDSKDTVTALLKAFKNHADVQVLADKSGSLTENKKTGEIKILFDKINGIKKSQQKDWAKITDEPTPADSSFVGLCRASCVSDKSINHQKFVTVSGSGGGTVIVSSANMLDEGKTTTTNSGDNAWNNSVVFSNDKAAYKAFSDEFVDQEKGWAVNTLHKSKYGSPKYPTGSPGVGSGAQVQFYPRPSLGVSPAVTLLKTVSKADCTNKSNPAVVNVAMDIFSDESVAKRLRVLSVQGCSVNVIATDHSQDAKALKDLQGCVSKHPSRVTFYKLKHAPGLVHSKYMIITGHFDAGTNPLVYTGTLNFDKNAYLNADNTEVILRGSAASNEFNANFDQLTSAAALQKGNFGLQKNAKCS